MTDIKKILKILRNNKSYLGKKYNVNEIGVFGSFSRGDQTKKSDIDLLVTLSKPIGLEFVDLSYELEELLNHKVDIVSKGALNKRMFNAIKEDLIYV